MGEGVRFSECPIANLHFQAWHMLVIVVQLKVGGLGLEVMLISKLLEQGHFILIRGSIGLHRHMLAHVHVGFV